MKLPSILSRTGFLQRLGSGDKQLPVSPPSAVPAKKLSVIVVVYNIPREARKTLYSLSARYQRDIAAGDYEVIVVDNGSDPPVHPDLFSDLEGDFRLIRIEPGYVSPAYAINRGLADARGEVIGVMIDGARIVSPGMLHFASQAASLSAQAVVATLGWYLGYDQQRWSVHSGYDKAREDAYLEAINWPSDGYRLFEISALDGSSVDGWFSPIAESNALFLHKTAWTQLGGFDERFTAPGGGLVNLDTFRRAMELPASQLVILLGEGTFHQLHGGVATNSPFEIFTSALETWKSQYAAIRGQQWAPPEQNNRTYLGVLPPVALMHLAAAATDPLYAAALGPTFDRSLWRLASFPRPLDAPTAALVDFAEAEFRARSFDTAAAVARIARAHAPDEPAPLSLLTRAGLSFRGQFPVGDRAAAVHTARGRAFEILGQAQKAEAEFVSALALDDDLPLAHLGLSRLRLPGDGYFAWLERFQGALVPEVYLEIGVARGQSIAYARPPTRAIGIDPEPNMSVPLRAETHIFCETSDAFFANDGLARAGVTSPISLAFIDGLHVFSQSLKDFINVEKNCSPRSVVLFHDTLPLDEPTQRADRARKFYTGDIWKTVVFLKQYRPDLEIFTVPTSWSGLTVVLGLDPASRVLADHYDEAISRFGDLPFSDVEHRLNDAMNVAENDWNSVLERLRSRGLCL